VDGRQAYILTPSTGHCGPSWRGGLAYAVAVARVRVITTPAVQVNNRNVATLASPATAAHRYLVKSLAVFGNLSPRSRSAIRFISENASVAPTSPLTTAIDIRSMVSLVVILWNFA
jgi:hypothetical protein